jgi:hypothetical protein
MSPRLWTWLSAVGLLLFVAIVAMQGAGVAGFDPAQQQISEYVHSSASAVMVVGFLAWSLSLLILAGLTQASARDHREEDWPINLQAGALVVAAVGAFLLACFPTDRGVAVPGVVTHASATGQIHDAASALCAASILVAALVGAMRCSGSIRALTAALIATGLASSVVLLAIGDPVPGIRQRVLVAAGCLWQATWLWKLRTEAVATSPRSSADSRCNTS